MFEKRNLKLDLFALLLLGVVIFLTVALITYDKADPPSGLVYPPRVEVNNACGRLGALAAHHLYELLGVGAFYVVLSMGALDVLLLLRRDVDQPVLRSIGWVMSLLGLVTLISLMFSQASPGPVIGPGGYLGAAGRGLLEMHFATIGSLVLTMSVILAGLLLTTDYVLLRFTAEVLNHSSRGMSRVTQVLGPESASAGKSSKPPETGRKIRLVDEEDEEELEDEYEEEEEDEELAIKIGGQTEEDEEDEEEYEEDEYEEDEEEEEEPSIAAKKAKVSVTKRMAKALRLKKPKATEKELDEREEVMAQLDAATHDEEPINYNLPSIELLMPREEVSYDLHEKEVRQKAKLLEKTFASFGFKVKVVEIETGPVIAQYEVELEAGLRLSRITSLSEDLAIALRVPSVRIVAPIPGKNTVGIEVPNSTRQMVRLREVMEDAAGKTKRLKIPIFLGKDVSGKPMTVDLASMPHLLIAGRTGTGKSVCLNSIIVSMLMTRGPDEVRMLMIDPKMVELSPYKTLPHLMHPVVTDMRKAEAILAWAVEKMEERYTLLARAGVRHLSVYNQLGEEELRDRLEPESDEEWKSIPKHMPYIVIVADEMADLMMTAGKDAEQHIIRLAQKSRAVGIHLILATQKPTVDVITGLIKSNLPARIAFQVSSRTDSRVVLDEMGADKLLGNGDMLFLQPGTSQLLRGQGTYLSDDEINSVIDCVGTNEPQFVAELVQLKTKEEQANSDPKTKLKNRDELYESAIEIVVREGRGSVSLLQRGLGIGYGRAARLVDFMAEDGIVGEYNGSQAREVLITMADWEAMSGEGGGDDSDDPPVAAAKPKPAPSKTVKLKPPVDEEEEDDEYEEDEYEEDELEDEELEDEEEDEYEEEDEEEEETDEDEEEDEEDEEEDQYEEEDESEEDEEELEDEEDEEDEDLFEEEEEEDAFEEMEEEEPEDTPRRPKRRRA